MDVAVADAGLVPTRDQAQDLARELLGDLGTKLSHVTRAGDVAERITSRLSSAGMLTPADAHLVVVAATVHDIGYSPAIAHTGFHPVDGAAHLQRLGWSPLLCRLVAHHSCAWITAPETMRWALTDTFPRDVGLLADSLAYSDMHSSPEGALISVEGRLADIARRHTHPSEAERAAALRLAIVRVGEALLLAERGRSRGSRMRRGLRRVRAQVPQPRRAS